MSKVHPINKKDIEKLYIIRYLYLRKIKPSLCWKIKRFYNMILLNRNINKEIIKNHKKEIIKNHKYEDKKIEPVIKIV